jgi:hypothetical protein
MYGATDPQQAIEATINSFQKCVPYLLCGDTHAYMADLDPVWFGELPGL